MKKIIYSIPFLLFDPCIFRDNIFSQSCCYSGWNFRAPITVFNGNASAQTNFEIADTINTQALISAGKMKNDGLP